MKVLDSLNAAVWVTLPLYFVGVSCAFVWWLVPSWRVLPVVVMLIVVFWVIGMLVIKHPVFADRVARHELPVEGAPSVPPSLPTQEQP